MIVYLTHDQVGHLGIFVSAKLAKKEHAEIANTLDLVEALAPGLYEMRIEGDEQDGFQVELVERSIEDVKRLSGDATSEEFPVVARVSQMFESI